MTEDISDGRQRRAGGHQMSYAVVDNQNHPAAPHFYRVSPREPIAPSGDLVVTSIHNLGRRPSALKLLRKLAAIPGAGRAQPVLVVAHGVPVGLNLPLVPTSASRFQTDSLGVFEEHELHHISSADAARTLSLNGAQFLEFIRLRDQIRAARFARIEFRACNTADTPSTLQAFQRFFRARAIGAPKEEDAYNVIPHRGGPFTHAGFRDFLRDHPGAVIVGSTGNQIAYVATRTGIVTWSMDFSADGNTVARNWYRTSYPGSKLRSVQKLWIHAQFGGGNLIFPNMPDYRANLIVV